MPPTWLTLIAWIWLGISFVSSGVILFDIFVRGHRQPMGVMDAVYPITALYLGALALAFYWRWARSPGRTSGAACIDQMAALPEMATVSAGPGMPGRDNLEAEPEGLMWRAAPARPRWVTLATEVSHCGAGCSLGDLIAEWTIYALALTVAGQALFAEYIGDFALALGLGIVFQYFAIAPMRGLGLKDGLKAAARADFISLTAFEIGLFGWMALMAFVFFPAPHHLMPNTAAYWFLMQIGMTVGFATSWPANVWLLNRGIKVAM
jgi:hypothetical protein